MNRGPKPIAIEALRVEAEQWALVLFCLRDGQKGMVNKLKWGPWRTTPPAEPRPELLAAMRGTPWEGAPRLKVPIRHRQGTTLVAEIIPADQEIVRKFLKEFKLGRNWNVQFPIFPEPELWEQIKTAASIAQMRSVLRSLEGYVVRNWVAWPQKQYPRRLERHGPALFRARRLFNYPRSGRKRSDDKRVVFFSKVIAGLELNRSPLYALKKLSKWRPIKEQQTNPFNEFAAHFPQKGAPK